MPRVQYLGPKARKTDNVANTDTVWLGTGDVQTVTQDVWSKLSAHPAVWRVVPDGEEPQPVAKPEPPAAEPLTLASLQEQAAALGCKLVPLDLNPGAASNDTPPPAGQQKPADDNVPPGEYVLVMGGDANPTYIVLDGMDAEQLHAFADKHDIKVDGRIKDAAKLRQIVYAKATGKEA